MIRKMQTSDRKQIIDMMREFYASPAVLSNGSEEIFCNDFNACVGDCPYAEGYVFTSDGKISGYAIIAKSFSTEFGKLCIWIEDLYIKSEFRGTSLGTEFMSFIEKTYPDHVLRLEVEQENKKAIRIYDKCGYAVLPYSEMIKIR